MRPFGRRPYAQAGTLPRARTWRKATRTVCPKSPVRPNPGSSAAAGPTRRSYSRVRYDAMASPSQTDQLWNRLVGGRRHPRVLGGGDAARPVFRIDRAARADAGGAGRRGWIIDGVAVGRGAGPAVATPMLSPAAGAIAIAAARPPVAIARRTENSRVAMISLLESAAVTKLDRMDRRPRKSVCFGGLVIAMSELRAGRADRRDNEANQARLVAIEPRDSGNQHIFKAVVHNHSDAPIFDLRIATSPPG
jgi:hypothetical protein